jgi:hypothetical protein
VSAAAHVSQKSLMTLCYDARNVEARQGMPISRMNLMTRRMNNMAWLWFIVGILLGAYFGFFIATILMANKYTALENELEKYRRLYTIVLEVNRNIKKGDDSDGKR